MLSQFSGMCVKLKSDTLGVITGTVVSVNDSKINLKNVIINESQTLPGFSVSNNVVSDIQIISVAPDNLPITTPEKTPGKSITKSTPRHERRELFKNIPNAENAYVCPESPPLVCKSNIVIKAPESRQVLKNSRLNNQQADSNQLAFSRINRSGYESDPANYKSSSKNKSRARSRNLSHKKSSQEVAWDSIAIEDFVDEEFDFEGNNAKFDKQACYSIIDAQRKKPSPASCSNVPQKLTSVVQKPNRQGKNAQDSTAEVGVEVNPMSLIKKLEADFKASVPPEARTSSSSESSRSPKPRDDVSHYLSVHQRNRLFHYFSTGIDPRKTFPPMEIPGLDWRRTVESLASSVANKILTWRVRSNTFRVVVVPTGPNFGGVLALTISRYLCDLGASVFIIVDGNSLTNEETPKKESRLASMYREEIRLLKDIYLLEMGPSRRLISDNAWERNKPGIEMINTKQMLGAKYEIDVVVWGHGFDVVNASSEFLVSVERWIALQAESMETRVDLVNLPNSLDTTFVTKRARQNVIFDIGFPVIFNDARATSAKRFVARLPTGERQLHNLIQKQGFEPAGGELHFNCESQVYQISSCSDN